MAVQPTVMHTNSMPLVTLMTVTTTCYPSDSPQQPLYLTPYLSNVLPIAPSLENPIYISPPPNLCFLPSGALIETPLLPSVDGIAYGSLSPPGAYPGTFNDSYLIPAPDSFSSLSRNGSIVDSGSERFDDYSENCDEYLKFTNTDLDDIVRQLIITQDTINGIVLDPSMRRKIALLPDPSAESLLNRINLEPKHIHGNSFTVSAKSLKTHGAQIHICAEVDGRFVLAKMLSEEVANGCVNVRFADEKSQFELTPGEIFVVTSDLEKNYDACKRPGLYHGLLVTDENHVVRGTLLQPHCVQLIIKTPKACMQVSIFVAKFVEQNKNGILRYNLAKSMDGMRLFMHMKDKETEIAFEKLRARFSHLPKSSEALYQADKNIRRAAKHLGEIWESGKSHLLNNDLMAERTNIDFETPKSEQQLLAYFANEGGIFPIGTESLSDIRYLELSLKSINEGNHHFCSRREDFANRCANAIRGLVNLFSVEVVKILDKYRAAMDKVISVLMRLSDKLEVGWQRIPPFQVCENSAESIMETLSNVHYRNSSWRRLYFRERINEDGAHVYKTEEKELRKALNALRNIELQFHNWRNKKLVKQLRRVCCQDDFKTVGEGEKVNPFFKKGSSELDERVLLGEMEVIFEECGIQHWRSEQHRFALLFENALAEERAKVAYADKQIPIEDVWLMLYGQQMKKTSNQR